MTLSGFAAAALRTIISGLLTGFLFAAGGILALAFMRAVFRLGVC